MDGHGLICLKEQCIWLLDTESVFESLSVNCTVFWCMMSCSLVDIYECSCKMVVDFRQTAQHHIPEDSFSH